MSQTNYTSLATCAAIGRNFAAILPKCITGTEYVDVPLMTTQERDFHLGGNTTFEQRLAFEWGVLGECSRRSGDIEGCKIADAAVDRLIRKAVKLC